MNFKDEIRSCIKTPQEADASKKDDIIYECRESAEKTFENIKHLLKETASKGEYETHNGYRVIKINPLVCDEYVTDSIFGPLYGKDIKCKFLFSTIGIKYDEKRIYSFWGKIKETIYTYNVFVKDDFKYQTFMNKLNSLASNDGIDISLKMRFEPYFNTVSQFETFPGVITGNRVGEGDALSDVPEEWIKLYMFIEMKL